MVIISNKTLSVCFLLFFSTTILFAQDYGITVFGTDLISKDKIAAKYSSELNSLRELYESDRDKYKKDKVKFEQKLITSGNFAYTNVRLFKSYANSYEFIIDFVEKQEANERMDYRKIKSKPFKDPDGILKKWKEYQDLSYQLFKDGEITDYSCPVIHCLWAFNHPKLEPYLAYFEEHTHKHKDELIKILHTSDSVQQRASAAFLLAHAKMKNIDLLNTLVPAIKDLDSKVRNNSLRVIYYITRANSTIKINKSEVIKVLDYPSFTDRNKALVILRSIPLDDLTKKDLEKLIHILLEILEKKDAHNYKNAHTVIKKLSKKEYGIDDLEKWKNWAYSFLKSKN